MAIPKRQILVCQSFRVSGDKKGICHKQTEGFLQYLEEEVLDRGLDCLISASPGRSWWSSRRTGGSRGWTAKRRLTRFLTALRMASLPPII